MYPMASKLLEVGNLTRGMLPLHELYELSLTPTEPYPPSPQGQVIGLVVTCPLMACGGDVGCLETTSRRISFSVLVLFNL